jgi:tetratricopeptide (TPR) repeat protein
MNFNKGIQAINEGDLKTAIECFNLAIKNNEIVIEAYIELGKCFCFIKDYKQALHHFSVAKLKSARGYYNFKTMPKETYIAYLKTISTYNLVIYNDTTRNELVKEELAQLIELITNKIPTVNFLKPIRD